MDRFEKMVVRGFVMDTILQTPEQWTSFGYLFESSTFTPIDIDEAVDSLASQGQLVADPAGRGYKPSVSTVMRWVKHVRQELPYATVDEVAKNMPYQVPAWWVRRLLDHAA